MKTTSVSHLFFSLIDCLERLFSTRCRFLNDEENKTPAAPPHTHTSISLSLSLCSTITDLCGRYHGSGRAGGSELQPLDT